MEFARSSDLPVIDHCEDLNLSAGGDMHEGVRIRAAGFARNPVCFGRRDGGARYAAGGVDRRTLSRGAYFHARSVAMVAFAKTQGLPVTLRSDAAPFRPHRCGHAAYDSNYKMKPPLRCGSDADAVIEGIVSGAIDAIATDHAPHAGSEKMQEFERCPFGITGLETAMGLSLETGSHGQNHGEPDGGVVHYRPAKFSG